MSIIDNAEKMVELAKKGLFVELRQQIIELQEQELELREENLGLKARIGELEKQAAISADLRFDGQVYWLGDEGPYCQRCHDESEKLVRLQKRVKQDIVDDRVVDAGYFHHCLACHSNYGE